jgi:hypothetical protein
LHSSSGKRYNTFPTSRTEPTAFRRTGSLRNTGTIASFVLDFLARMIVAIPTMPTFAPSLVHTPCGPSPSLSDVNRRKHQSQQPRQLLSCTKCRERKVKCDRTKPCSACCARGAPKECHFIAESGDYAPIQQSYELRKLRAENLRLKERLRASRISIEEEGSDQSSESQIGERPGSSSQRKRTTRQRRFQGSEWSDSIYFGSPGLASVISDVSESSALGSRD